MTAKLVAVARLGGYGTAQDGTNGDDPGPAWTEWLKVEGTLPGINIYHCPDYPSNVSVNYFLTAYATWERNELYSTLTDSIRFPAEFVVSGDCTNPLFYAPPFGTNDVLKIDDADMDNASDPCLNVVRTPVPDPLMGAPVPWLNPQHLARNNNVLFGDSHVTAASKFDRGRMTLDTEQRGVAWGELTPPAGK